MTSPSKLSKLGDCHFNLFHWIKFQRELNVYLNEKSAYISILQINLLRNRLFFEEDNLSWLASKQIRRHRRHLENVWFIVSWEVAGKILVVLTVVLGQLKLFLVKNHLKILVWSVNYNFLVIIRMNHYTHPFQRNYIHFCCLQWQRHI